MMTPIPLPLLGLAYAVRPLGMNDIAQGFPDGSAGMSACTQSCIEGMPLPEVVGKLSAPKPLPPPECSRRSATIARLCPGTIAIPVIPLLSLVISVRVWICLAEVDQVPVLASKEA